MNSTEFFEAVKNDVLENLKKTDEMLEATVIKDKIVPTIRNADKCANYRLLQPLTNTLIMKQEWYV